MIYKMEAVVYCEHPGVLLNYSALLNTLGCFRVSVCSTMHEVSRCFSSGVRFDFFIYDSFRCQEVDRRYLLHISAASMVNGFLLVGDIEEGRQSELFRWAKTNNVPLMGVLQQPVRHAALDSIIRLPRAFAQAL